MSEHSFMSIGEVLSLLKEEFPDVTISKIRFLESQGLIDPERTPSGYRKFYEQDVSRLRWILRQQREHFLPLKVIKGRLSGSEQPRGRPPTPDRAVARAAGEKDGGRLHLPRGEDQGDPLAGDISGASLTLAELSSASNLGTDDLAELEGFGLLSGRPMGDTTYYDEEALGVATLAAGFMKFGVEARHLRMYKTTAEREAGFFEQVVLPMLKQRNPQARQQAVDALSELARLGQHLRGAMLRRALAEHLDT